MIGRHIFPKTNKKLVRRPDLASAVREKEEEDIFEAVNSVTNSCHTFVERVLN